MKKTILLIAIPFMSATFFYLVFSLINWNFNGQYWSFESRAVCGAFIILGLILSWIAVYTDEDI